MQIKKINHTLMMLMCINVVACEKQEKQNDQSIGYTQSISNAQIKLSAKAFSQKMQQSASDSEPTNKIDHVEHKK